MTDDTYMMSPGGWWLDRQGESPVPLVGWEYFSDEGEERLRPIVVEIDDVGNSTVHRYVMEPADKFRPRCDKKIRDYLGTRPRAFVEEADRMLRAALRSRA